VNRNIGVLNLSRWLFPLGATLAVGSLAMSAMSPVFLFSALGCVLAIVGAVFDKLRLPAEQSRMRGKLCLLFGGVSLILFWVFGNVHTWTFTFLPLMLAGFISAAVFFF